MAAARFASSGVLLGDNDAGKPLSGGKINFWTSGTTNNLDTFPTSSLSSANANPLILDSNGRVPEAWANASDLFSIRILDSNDNVILPTVDGVSFISPLALTAASVLAVLTGNSDPVDLDGASMDGSGFADFIAALTLGAAGSIDASAGSIILGTVTGVSKFTSPELTTPVFKTSISGNAFLDQDDMASDSAVKLASQQSIKAFVLAQVAGAGFSLDQNVHTTSFTVASNTAYLIDTSAGSLNITMKNNPSLGDAFALMDLGQSFATNPPAFIQAASGEKIFFANENGQLSIQNYSGALWYPHADSGWTFRGF